MWHDILCCVYNLKEEIENAIFFGNGNLRYKDLKGGISDLDILFQKLLAIQTEIEDMITALNKANSGSILCRTMAWSRWNSL